MLGNPNKKVYQYAAGFSIWIHVLTKAAVTRYLFTSFMLRNATTGTKVTNVIQYRSKADSSKKPTGHLFNIHHACQDIADGLIKGYIVVVLYKCVTHMYGTEVPVSIRFLLPQRQMQAQ